MKRNSLGRSNYENFVEKAEKSIYNNSSDSPSTYGKIKNTLVKVNNRIDEIGGNAIYKILSVGTPSHKEPKSSKKDRYGDIGVLSGLTAGAVEGVVTLPILGYVNRLPLTVIETKEGLYDLVEKRILEGWDITAYNLAKIKLGPFPLPTLLWAGAAVATAVGTGAAAYYVSKRFSGKDKNES